MKLPFDNRYQNQISRTRHHLYIAPHPLLRPYVAHYTLILPGEAPEAPSETLALIPDASGCLVFKWERGRLSSSVFGATTHIVEVKNDLSDGPPRFFVEFLPGGLRLFHREVQWELTDRRVPLELLNRELSRQVEQAWLRCAQWDDLFLELDRILLSMIGEKELPAALRHGMELLRQREGVLTIAELSARMCYSERQVSRLFREHLGMGGKSYARLLRVNAAILKMERATHLSALAQDAGFYDQPHFIHEFKEVCGVSPGRYLQKKSVFYNETLKF